MLIQNYCDLTLENMTVDATVGTNTVSYTLSNNCGNVTIKGNTNIYAKSGYVAFDLWYGLSSKYYDGVAVTFDDTMTGEVVGNIEYGAQVNGEGWQDKTELTIKSGDFTGASFEKSGLYGSIEDANIVITGGLFAGSADIDSYLPEGYTASAKGGNVVASPSAESAAASIDGVYFSTIQDAFGSSESGETVKLENDVTWTQVAGDTTVFDLDGVTFDLNDKIFTAPNFSVVFQGDGMVIKNGKMNAQGPDANKQSYALFVGDERYTTNITIEDVTTTGGINIYDAGNVVIKNCDVTGYGYYAVWCDENADAIIEGGTH